MLDPSTRYAGFWPRFWAGWIDAAVVAPLIALSFWSLTAPRTAALSLEIPLTLAFAFYNIYFTGRWGQTIGKMALKIKVVALDGTDAGLRRAFYRHSVDLGLSMVASGLTIYALMSVTDAEYALLAFDDRLGLPAKSTASLSDIVNNLYLAWIASELVVLLLNRKRRALHDFIAGTVVIHLRPGASRSAPP